MKKQIILAVIAVIALVSCNAPVEKIGAEAIVDSTIAHIDTTVKTHDTIK